jgi:opacity protein-like surface antigen
MTRSNLISGLATAALCLAPIGAFAQATDTQTTTTTITTTTQTTMPTDYSTSNYSIVSGAIGGAFGGDSDDGTFGFDVAYDYLHRGAFGFEFLGTFTPDLDLNSSATLVTAGDTRVNTYMFNAIGAVPLGLDDNWLPYASGGLGAITARNDLELPGDTSLQLIDDNQFGGNIGFGLMGFCNQIGVRGDVRYFTGIGEDNSDAVNGLTENLNFWRSTVGVSFRW